MRRTLINSAAVLALAGCGDGAIEAGNGASAGNEAARSYTSPDGRSEVRSGDAALSGLPEGIPPYPRASPGGAIQFGGVSDEGEMRAMGFTTVDPPAEVIAFYADVAGRAGFREIHRAASGPSQVLGFERDNGDVMNVTATATPRHTSVQILTGTGQGRR
ncbi:MAG: hypothetical protein ACXWUX_11840 [Allosphingosinicella sp.]